MYIVHTYIIIKKFKFKNIVVLRMSYKCSKYTTVTNGIEFVKILIFFS